MMPDLLLSVGAGDEDKLPWDHSPTPVPAVSRANDKLFEPDKPQHRTKTAQPHNKGPDFQGQHFSQEDVPNNKCYSFQNQHSSQFRNGASMNLNGRTEGNTWLRTTKCSKRFDRQEDIIKPHQKEQTHSVKPSPPRHKMLDKLFSQMNRLSIDLNSGDSSTLTHVTQLDNNDDSILTTDESFFERNIPYNTVISKTEFHPSDVSTISDNTISGKSSRTIVQSKFCPGDVSSFTTDSDTIHSSQSQSVRDLGFLDDTLQSEDISVKEMYMKSEKGKASSNSKTLKHVSSNGGNVNSNNNINKNLGTNPDMDALWSEVQACKHARLRSTGAAVLDTAFVGRGSGSVYSDASTVDYVYTDRENGIRLVERHLPSLAGSQASRRYNTHLTT